MPRVKDYSYTGRRPDPAKAARTADRAVRAAMDAVRVPSGDRKREEAATPAVRTRKPPGPGAIIMLVAIIAMGWSLWTLGRSSAPAAAAAPAAATGTTQVPALAGPPLVISDVSGPLGTVLADLRISDRKGIEAWTAAGYAVDLQALITVTDDANGTDPLNVNARVFSTDASAYLADNGGILSPGWRGEYAQVRADLARLAADTGMTPPGPAPADVSTRPDMTLPWQPPANTSSAAPACTTKNTVTNSSSSTGAHSQSVKTTTKCGTGTSATTSSHTTRTSVSAKGKVTVTNTNTSG